MAEQLASIGQSIQVAISNLSSEVALGHIISSIPMWDGNSAGCDQFIKKIRAGIVDVLTVLKVNKDIKGWRIMPQIICFQC